MSDYISPSERHPQVPVTGPDIPVQMSPAPRLQLKPIMGQALLGRIVSRGSIIPAASFPDENTHKIILTLAGNRRRIELLVITPDTDPANAEQAFALAADTNNRHTATQILTDLTRPADD